MTVLEQRLMESAATYFAKQNNNKIDWEQRRYEIAKEVLPVCIGTSYREDWDVKPELVSMAVKYADALIAELKK